MSTRSGTVVGDDVDIFFDEFGDPADPPVLLIMGLGAQMVFWRTEFCEQIAARGYRVIRFDNRDAGLSGKLDGAHSSGGSLPIKALKFYVGLAVPGAPYTLHDMAGDAVRVLDHLGIDRAHIVGASLGGMIAQVFAAEHSDRLLSATIVMSSNNRPFLPPPGFRQLRALLSPPPPGSGRDEIIANSVRVADVIGSPVFRRTREIAFAHATEYFDRAYYPIGFARQFAAILTTGRLDGYNRRTTARVLVLHGTHDKLLRPSGARAIAKTIDSARLVMVDGMAHDLPRDLWVRIVEEFTGHFAGDH